MIALAIALMVGQLVLTQAENGPPPLLVQESVAFPELSNRDLVVDFGYFGPLVMLDQKTLDSLKPFRNNRAFQRRIIESLGAPDKYAVAQLILVHFHGWGEKANELLPGIFGLEMQYGKDFSTLFNRKRSDALRIYWELETTSREDFLF